MKIIKNNTGSPLEISDVGITLDDTLDYIIPTGNYPLWAVSNDVIINLGNGNITVNDGSQDLSIAQGVALLQSNFAATDFVASLKENDRLKLDVVISENQLIKVSSNDQTFGYLEQKIIGTLDQIEVDVLDEGNDEKLQVSLSNVGASDTYGNASEVPTLTTDDKGRVVEVVNTPISIASTQITDFNEAAQDAIGNILTDSTSIDFTYNGGSNQISASIIPSGVDHDALQNFVANEHLNHSNISIVAGTGLNGGGNLTASRTLNIANTSVSAGSYGSSNQIPTFTVNAQGQLTAAANVKLDLTTLQATATGTTTTTSGTKSLMSGMTLTPPAGTYLAMFSGSIQTNAAGSICDYSFFVGGTEQATSIREVSAFDGGVLSSGPAACSANIVDLVTVNGSQAVEVRWSRTAGTASSFQRTLTLLEIS